MAAVWWVTMPERSWDRIERTGLVRVGYAVEPPYAFPLVEGSAGGEFPESAKMIVERMGGFRIEWRLADFGLLMDLLESGEIDVVAAGLFVTPEREAKVAFAPPIVAVRAGLLVRKGNPRGLQSYESLVDSHDVRVAVLAGAVEHSRLRGLGVPPERILIVPDARSGQVAVTSGAADALALSWPTVAWLASHDWAHGTEGVMTGRQSTGSGGPAGVAAFAFRRDDERLLREWTRAQNEVQQSGEAGALAQRYGFVAIVPEKQ